MALLHQRNRGRGAATAAAGDSRERARAAGRGTAGLSDLRRDQLEAVAAGGVADGSRSAHGDGSVEHIERTGYERAAGTGGEVGAAGDAAGRAALRDQD